MLFTGLGRSVSEEIVPEVLSTAQGLRPTASVGTQDLGHSCFQYGPSGRGITHEYFQKCGNKFHIFKLFTQHKAEGRTMDRFFCSCFSSYLRMQGQRVRIVRNFMRKTTEVSSAPLNTMFSSVMTSFETSTALFEIIFKLTVPFDMYPLFFVNSFS